jgi:mono/diheme cytochrome c family protein
MNDAHRPAGPPPTPPREESVGSGLAIAQFAVTAILLGLVATLAYLAGMRSAGKEGGGGASSATSQPGAAVDLATLLKPTPELIAKGKTLFAVNCASCHGADGYGNGPAALALNPKPRNYHEGYWRYGGGVARIVQTISVGSPGTAMASFTNIPLEDRFALAHYVRTFAPKPEADKPEDLAWLGPIGGSGAGQTPGSTLGAMAKPGPTIPIELALRLLVQEAPPQGVPAVGPPPSPDAPGAALYAQRCASCHGPSGEGGIRIRMLGSSPYAYLTTLPLSLSRTGWVGDPARFEKLVLEGIPGYVMPGNGDLSRDDVRQLYDFSANRKIPAPAGANRS